MCVCGGREASSAYSEYPPVATTTTTKKKKKKKKKCYLYVHTSVPFHEIMVKIILLASVLSLSFSVWWWSRSSRWCSFQETRSTHRTFSQRVLPVNLPFSQTARRKFSKQSVMTAHRRRNNNRNGWQGQPAGGLRGVVCCGIRIRFPPPRPH